MASKRYKFHINTSSICFLCQDDISYHDDEASNGNSFSLKDIFHYLSIKLNKIPTLSTKPVKLLNKTDVRVSLCDKCQKTFEEISKLYRKMEVIKMKLDYNFEFVHQKVGLSFKKPPKSVSTESCFGQLGKSTEEKSLRHSKLVQELREEILEKCNIKMPNYHPRVTVEMVSDFMNRSTANVGITTVQQLPIVEYSSGVKTEFSSKISTKRSCMNEESYDDFTSQSQLFKQESEDDVSLDIGSGFHEIENSKDVKLNLKEKDFSNDSVSKQELLVTQSACPTGKRNELNDISQTTPTIKSKQRWNKIYKKNLVTGMFQCLKCDKECKHVSAIYAHYHAYHLRTRFNCSTCGKEHKYQRDLCVHRKTCQQNLEKRLAKEHDPKFKFVCDVCGKRWDTKEGLSKHRHAVHRNADRFSCDVCHKNLTSKPYLKIHKDMVHFGKKFTCGFCKRRFGISYKKRHERLCQQKIKIKFESPFNN